MVKVVLVHKQVCNVKSSKFALSTKNTKSILQHFVKKPLKKKKTKITPKLRLSKNDKIHAQRVIFLSQILLVSQKPSSHPGICYRVPFFFVLLI